MVNILIVGNNNGLAEILKVKFDGQVKVITSPTVEQALGISKFCVPELLVLDTRLSAKQLSKLENAADKFSSIVIVEISDSSHSYLSLSFKTLLVSGSNKGRQLCEHVRGMLKTKSRNETILLSRESLTYMQNSTCRLALDIYSGRKNPVLELGISCSGELRERLSKLILNVKPLVRKYPTFGYRGFWIDYGTGSQIYVPAKIMSDVLHMPKVQNDFLKIHSNVLNKFHANSFLKYPAFAEAYSLVEKGLSPSLSSKTSLDVTCPMCKAEDAPIYTDSNQYSENCYAYALNLSGHLEPGYTQYNCPPGNTDGFNCSDLVDAAIVDGLKKTIDFNANLKPNQGWYVALCISTSLEDYHWFRQDSHGCWSHKCGASPIKNEDQSKLKISDPLACDRGPYDQFCGYMITPSC